MRRLAALAPARLREADAVGIDLTDILQLARDSLVAVMRGPGALERLHSANVSSLPKVTPVSH